MTSIKWLESMVKGMVDNGGDLGEDYPALMVHIQQAKLLHEQETIEAWEMGRFNIDAIGSGEEYYKETYKKD